jgi:hypothetical protein
MRGSEKSLNVLKSQEGAKDKALGENQLRICSRMKVCSARDNAVRTYSSAYEQFEHFYNSNTLKKTHLLD